MLYIFLDIYLDFNIINVINVINVNYLLNHKGLIMRSEKNLQKYIDKT